MGEATEVDKTIIDGIADPLMHLVRNAMDHAIEDKNGRVLAKKDPVGRIILFRSEYWRRYHYHCQ